MDIVYVYTRKRSEFGRQCNFTDRPSELLCDIAPDASITAMYIERNPVDKSMQSGGDQAEDAVNTDRKEIETRGVNHVEGGWPRDVNPNEFEQVSRFRKKIEKDDQYPIVLTQLAETVEEYIKQNLSLDIYEEYFRDTENNLLHEDTTAKTLNVFQDPSPIVRSSVHISWFTDGPRKFAVACNDPDLLIGGFKNTIDSYIWDIEYPNRPELVLKPNSAIVSLEFNPKDPNIIFSGLQNGQVALWDIRRPGDIYESSRAESSHREQTNCVLWIQSKTGCECFSASTDGQIFWWDTRKLFEPIESMVMDLTKKQDINCSMGVTVLEYESTVPTKFMTGLDNGSIVSCNRKAKSPSEKILATYNGHYSPVYSLQRSPYFPKIFLSVADWTTRIWSEDVKDASIWATKPAMSFISNGCWSYSRPSVFFRTKMNGVFEAWNLLHDQKEPVYTMQVSNEPLLCMKASDEGRLILIGTKDGATKLIGLDEGFTQPIKNEKNIVAEIFERETRREKVLEVRHRELKMKDKNKNNESKSQKGNVSDRRATVGAATDDEIDLVEKAEKMFFEVIDAERKRRERVSNRRADDNLESDEKQDKGKTSPIIEGDEEM